VNHQTQIPNDLIGIVSKVLVLRYTHSDLDALFLAANAPGDPPFGNKAKKCMQWMSQCNSNPSINALKVFGKVIEEYMEEEPVNDAHRDGQCKIRQVLVENRLAYQKCGRVVLAGSHPVAKTLEDFLSGGDFPVVEKEFERAFASMGSDPHAAVTAASAILEAACKLYITKFKLAMPPKQIATLLWKPVKEHLLSTMESEWSEDIGRIWTGLSSTVVGIGTLRTHAGSAHGHSKTPQITAADARLAVNAAHTLVVFIMERGLASDA